MSGGAKFDPTQVLAEFVPGAIAGDIIGAGATRDIFVGGAVSALGATIVFGGDESANSESIRTYFRKAPYLGLGAGYAAARYAGLDYAPALGVGLLGAVAMMAFKKTSAPPTPGGSDSLTNAFAGALGNLRAYTAVSPEAPQAPPAAQYNIVSPFV